MGRFKFSGILLVACVFFFACKKDEEAKPSATITDQGIPHELEIGFDAIVNGKPLQPAVLQYTNTSNDSLSITKFTYYVSNVKLKREDGTVFSEKESYHLIKHVGDSTSFTIKVLPAGNYKAIEFLIGVDSLRNVSGAQTGALDPINNMFWDWEQGYLFFKLEGDYKSNNVPTGSAYSIHIGGFNGKFKSLQKCSFNLSTPIVSEKAKHSLLNFHVLVDEIFEHPAIIGFDTYYSSITDSMFKAISDNYKDMFVVNKIEN